MKVPHSELALDSVAEIANSARVMASAAYSAAAIAAQSTLTIGHPDNYYCASAAKNALESADIAFSRVNESMDAQLSGQVMKAIDAAEKALDNARNAVYQARCALAYAYAADDLRREG